MALAFIGGGNIVGTFLAGWLGGKYPAQKGRLLAAIYFLRAVLFLLMAVLPDHEVIIIVFAGLLGILYLSTVPLTAGLVQDMVGLKYNSTMFGFAFASHQLGSFFGSWLWPSDLAIGPYPGSQPSQFNRGVLLGGNREYI